MVVFHYHFHYTLAWAREKKLGMGVCVCVGGGVLLGLPGPKNWQPRVRTAAHKLAESCWGFWCARINSVTERSPRLRAARAALDLPSSSTSWQLISTKSLRCMGRLSTHPALLWVGGVLTVRPPRVWIKGCWKPDLLTFRSVRSSLFFSSSFTESEMKSAKLKSMYGKVTSYSIFLLQNCIPSLFSILDQSQ